MYTIGQIADITGISRDKLRYYEEKGILKPVQNKENNYRQYGLKDIDTVLSIELYRSLELDFRTIEKLYRQGDIKSFEAALEKKRNQVMGEISRLNAILDGIRKVQRGCQDIRTHLNQFSIRPMESIKILGELSDFRAYEEYDAIHKNRLELKEAPIVQCMKRYITFTDEGLTSKMLVAKPVSPEESLGSRDACREEVLRYDKCAYTIVEDCRETADVMQKTFLNSLAWISGQNYRHKGIAVVGMLLMLNEDGMEKAYLEIHIPIE